MIGLLLCILTVAMLLALFRASRGPTVFDRVLAVNSFGTLTVLFMVALSVGMGRSDFFDLALLYALLNFIGVVAVLRFAKYGFFAGPQRAPEKAE